MCIFKKGRVLGRIPHLSELTADPKAEILTSWYKLYLEWKAILR